METKTICHFCDISCRRVHQKTYLKKSENGSTENITLQHIYNIITE